MANSSDQVPQYVVYCDESCHDLTAHHRFMTIGSLWVPRKEKDCLSRQFRDLCRSLRLHGEVKWSKVSAKRLQDYERLVDFFFSSDQFRFRTIVVDQSKVKLEEYHASNKELAFYKFYYEMLKQWLEAGNEYLILLDHKDNHGADRYTMLKTFLDRHLMGKAWISDLTVISSRETPLAQLCDLLTGSVAAAYNGHTLGGAKEALADHIAHKAALRSLKTGTPRSVSKFNIFKIDLG